MISGNLENQLAEERSCIVLPGDLTLQQQSPLTHLYRDAHAKYIGERQDIIGQRLRQSRILLNGGQNLAGKFILGGNIPVGLNILSKKWKFEYLQVKIYYILSDK